jgi:hypothetical protein
MCFLKDFNENRPRMALILRLTAIVGVDMINTGFSNDWAKSGGGGLKARNI